MRQWVVVSAMLVVAIPALLLGGCQRATESPVREPGAVQTTAEAVQLTIAVVETAAEAPIEGALPAVDPISVTGDIVTAGSSTVYPLSEVIADRFKMDGYAGRISIDMIGTGAGFERFCTAGETDVSNASRPIKDEEAEACRAIGREPIELKIATDALAVVVSLENGFAQDITLAELALAFSTAETWSDVRPEWPAEPIERFAPGTDSGTFDYFVEEIFDDDPEPHLAAAGLQQSEDDNYLVKGVQSSPYAIGYFGYAYLTENTDTLRALAVEGVEPTAASVDSGAYPLARPLFLYTTAEILQEKPQVAAFVNYFLSNVNDAVAQVGYFPASPDALTLSREAWLDAVGR